MRKKTLNGKYEESHFKNSISFVPWNTNMMSGTLKDRFASQNSHSKHFITLVFWLNYISSFTQYTSPRPTWQSDWHRKSFTRSKNLLNAEGRLSHVCVFLFTDDLKDKCEKLLCKCDKEAAKCLRKAPFIKKYALWPDFLCGFKQPMCSIYWHNKCICMSHMPFVNRVCHS